MILLAMIFSFATMILAAIALGVALNAHRKFGKDFGSRYGSDVRYAVDRLSEDMGRVTTQGWNNAHYVGALAKVLGYEWVAPNTTPGTFRKVQAAEVARTSSQQTERA